MSKTLDGVQRQICICWDGINYQLRYATLLEDPKDNADTNISYKRTGDAYPETLPRDLTAEELTTLTPLLSAIDTNFSTQENII